ncbi:hypothetical protein EW145_g2647 [Phellinidium pouzarii]|uniref:Uncharacterized protein n=1 Tax=Phellinidium pouzarii TaxID=167371 RepID=A0A4S4LA28_9AGAM|nr:hypothetical protein EW145_g2647 [Phellinidium pouzarii]
MRNRAAAHFLPRDDSVNCGDGGGDDDFTSLRIASIFIIMIGSTFGSLFPVVARRTRIRNVIPKAVFEFAKYFGSGVIIATAFIHLLDPAVSELGSPCLTGNWQVYPWALALCMLSIFIIFFVELFAFRLGTAKLAKLGMTYDAHGHDHIGTHAAHGPEPAITTTSHLPDSDSQSASGSNVDIEKNMTSAVGTHTHAHGHGKGVIISDSALAQIVGIFILEFGILLHSILIGLTLAVSNEFKVLFVVLAPQKCSKVLALVLVSLISNYQKKYNYVAYVAALLYGLTTPLGIAVGLGVRSTYNPDSARASAVSGILDSLSAGVLIYTGLVELLAHEFLFSQDMRAASSRKLGYACVCMLFGAGIMSLLGRWA